MTAHKLLYQSYPRKDGTFFHMPKRPLDYPYKVIVVDEISMLPKICKTTKNYNPKIPAQSGNRGGKVVETEVETLEKYGGYLFIFCKKSFWWARESCTSINSFSLRVYFPSSFLSYLHRRCRQYHRHNCHHYR